MSQPYDVLVARIRKVAAWEAKTDNDGFDCDLEFAEWGYDSAYSAGTDDGAILFARQLLPYLEMVEKDAIV